MELDNKQMKEVMLHEKHEAARKKELEHLINHAVATVHPKLHFLTYIDAYTNTNIIFTKLPANAAAPALNQSCLVSLRYTFGFLIY